MVGFKRFLVNQIFLPIYGANNGKAGIGKQMHGLWTPHHLWMSIVYEVTQQTDKRGDAPWDPLYGARKRKKSNEKNSGQGVRTPPLSSMNVLIFHASFFLLPILLSLMRWGFCLFFSFNMDIGFNQPCLWLFSVHHQPFL